MRAQRGPFPATRDVWPCTLCSKCRWTRVVCTCMMSSCLVCEKRCVQREQPVQSHCLDACAHTPSNNTLAHINIGQQCRSRLTCHPAAQGSGSERARPAAAARARQPPNAHSSQPRANSRAWGQPVGSGAARKPRPCERGRARAPAPHTQGTPRPRCRPPRRCHRHSRPRVAEPRAAAQLTTVAPAAANRSRWRGRPARPVSTSPPCADPARHDERHVREDGGYSRRLPC